MPFTVALVDPHETLEYYRFGAHNYIIEFLRKYRPHIYLSRFKDLFKLRQFLRDIGSQPNHYKIHYSKNSLFECCNVLAYLNGGVHADASLFRDFPGLKIYHIMDPQYYARELNEFLMSTNIHYLMGYNSYDKHSDFARMMYPTFGGKILGIPFGFSSPWRMTVPFSERKDMAILSGTMETFEKVRIDKYYHAVKDYYDFFSNRFNSMHEIRYLIDRDIANYSGFVDNQIHHWPAKDNFKKDVVAEFNKYKYFINDESLLNFCPIRTYEGIAAGCVMIAHRASCFEEFGFVDGRNCLMFDDVNDIRKIIARYNLDRDGLSEIQRNGIEFVVTNYSHDKIADLIMTKIDYLWKEHTRKPILS